MAKHLGKSGVGERSTDPPQQISQTVTSHMQSNRRFLM